ncbi:MAG TPA: hypothetical protein VIJ95_17995 [Hanamia sp.]
MAKYLLGSCLLCLLFASCKKEDSNFTSASINDYFPLKVGKYITYNLDSTVIANFGLGSSPFVVNHYQAQDVVDAEITDNLGRSSFRIMHYIRNDSTQLWIPNNTFMVTSTRNSLEYVENNLRYLKLMLPISEGFTWKGNSYIDTYDNDLGLTYLDDWDYTYDSVGAPLTINSLNFDSTITVDERDEFLGQDPSLDSTQYATKTYSVEKYAKGIGLIYRNFLHWEYQSPQSIINPGYTGYGVTLSIIDHN